MKRRIAGAFSHRLISPRTFLVIVHCLPWSLGKLFYNNVAHAARLPSCLLGKKETIPFFFPFLPFKARPRKQRAVPSLLEAGPKRISEYFQTFVLIALTEQMPSYCVSLSLSPYPWNVTLRSYVDVTRYSRIFVFFRSARTRISW